MKEFIDLKSQYLKIESAINSNIQNVLNHGKYIMGPEVQELENKLAEFVGVKYCITCSNGTDALQMMLMAWNIGPGDAVFLPSFTFMSTAEVVRLVGATPIFVDSDLRTYNIDSNQLETAIVHVLKKGLLKPKAIIAVDLFGRLADYEAVERVAQKYDLKILEDAAQSFGSSCNGKKAGSFGDAATTSFFPAKPLGCYGDGGAIFTDNEQEYAYLKSIRVHGQGSDKYDNVRIGLNARLDTIQAAILLAKLDVFDQELLERKRVSEMYNNRLSNKVMAPHLDEGHVSAWAQYSVLAKSFEHRQELQKILKDHEIPSMIYYQKPLHLQKAFSDCVEHQLGCPVAEDLSSRILSLPMHPYLENEEIEIISEIINSLGDY